MEKIKQFFKETLQSEKGKDVLVVIIVILVGTGSFELGRLSKENASESLKILPAVATETNVSKTVFDTNSTGKNFFASSKGSKYYTTNCSAGKTIKTENRIYFTTGEEAQAAGYSLSSSCN
jgi:hypothetical protein